MKTSRTIFFCVLALVGFGRQESAVAQETSTSPIAIDEPVNADLALDELPSLALLGESGPDKDVWRFDLNAWIWLPSMSGDVGVRDITASVDVTFVDILDVSDSLIGIAGRLEVGKGDWAGFVDGMYDKIGVNNASGPLGIGDVDAVFEMGIVDFGLMYRLGDWPVERISAEALHKDVILDLYAGARYTVLSLELDPAHLASRKRDKDWIDPIMGAKVAVPISDRFRLLAWGDIGGFGVSSDFTWSATGVIGYDFKLFNLPATVYAGYRGLGDDYTSGSGATRFVWDVTMYGPILGMEIKF